MVSTPYYFCLKSGLNLQSGMPQYYSYYTTRLLFLYYSLAMQDQAAVSSLLYSQLSSTKMFIQLYDVGNK